MERLQHSIGRLTPATSLKWRMLCSFCLTGPQVPARCKHKLARDEIRRLISNCAATTGKWCTLTVYAMYGRGNLHHA
ncbi:hypothetical protein BAUCODRAFT_39599 [Baudoinia panamericana UAMH 10762]|uniref:Uncharacterized protein n=1 Tax=Baudoinia panamericana (strain UAMH 10762) TaxID=717646 RepID=M2LBZ1_BAUPA|nr:uncharacterized protein BAUCODRAFT_39599 [Baudoinia panamericana UAMH 10762]EMC91427.1 hypothetical protein BAUCODRAFT_39599 [Baudoinia panamericana UAMH 10762]